MADWFLILAITIAFFLLFVAGVYLIVHYQHPDDKNEAWFPKITVLLGFMLAGATVLLLPLDVANNENYPGCAGYDTKVCGGLNMNLFWDIFYWAIPIFVFILIPFMTFYYEADDGMLMAGTIVGAKPNSRFLEALKYEMYIIVIFALIFIPCYLLLSDAKVPIKQFIGSTNGVEYTTAPGDDFSSTMFARMGNQDLKYMTTTDNTKKGTSIIIALSIASFFAGFMAFIGWFVFAVFGGIGLASLPLDLILSFVNRPRHLDAVEFADVQMSLRERVNKLVDQGELLKIQRDERELTGTSNKGTFSRFSKQGREEHRALLDFKKAVYLLETDVKDFHDCTDNYKNYNPLIPWFSLFFGFLAIIISIAWVIQICIYVLPPNPVHPFLNTYLASFDKWMPLFGVLSVAILSVYLLFAAIKGCFKFGLRFLMFQLHPMEVNKTYMSSFMFNTGLVLLCALPVVQFTTVAFKEYARYTTVNNVMNTQVRYLKFFSWFWKKNVFVIALMSILGLTVMYLIFCKRADDSKSSVSMRDRLKTNAAKSK